MVEIFNFLAYKENKEAKAKENIKREESNFGDKIDYGKLTELLNLVTELISQNLGDDLRGRAYQAEYNIVHFFTDAKIINLINNFDEREVTAGPLFYSALIDATKAKGLFRSLY